MTKRRRLSNRRPSESFGFESNGFKYVATISRFADGGLAEIYLTNGKCGSDADTAAKDAAVVCSLALQHGTPLDVIRKALMRNTRGEASGALGAPLDAVAGNER
jgi:hypothetical protein